MAVCLLLFRCVYVQNPYANPLVLNHHIKGIAIDDVRHTALVDGSMDVEAEG